MRLDDQRSGRCSPPLLSQTTLQPTLLAARRRPPSSSKKEVRSGLLLVLGGENRTELLSLLFLFLFLPRTDRTARRPHRSRKQGRQARTHTH